MPAPEHFDSCDLHEQRVRPHDHFAYRYRVPVDEPSASSPEIQERLERSAEDFAHMVEQIRKETAACCRDEIEREAWLQVLSTGACRSDAVLCATRTLRDWLGDMEAMLRQQIADARAEHIIRNWWIRLPSEPRRGTVVVR